LAPVPIAVNEAESLRLARSEPYELASPTQDGYDHRMTMPRGDMTQCLKRGRDEPAPRMETTVQRLVRNTKVAQHVKKLHKHRRQICGQTLTVAAGLSRRGPRD
jgi:hypothetical protein